MHDLPINEVLEGTAEVKEAASNSAVGMITEAVAAGHHFIVFTSDKEGTMRGTVAAAPKVCIAAVLEMTGTIRDEAQKEGDVRSATLLNEAMNMICRASGVQSRRPDAPGDETPELDALAAGAVKKRLADRLGAALGISGEQFMQMAAQGDRSSIMRSAPDSAPEPEVTERMPEPEFQAFHGGPFLRPSQAAPEPAAPPPAPEAPAASDAGSAPSSSTEG